MKTTPFFTQQSIKKFIQRWAPFFFLLGITGVFFWKSVFHGFVPFPGDLLISEYKPWSTESFLGYAPGGYPQKAQYFDTLRQLYPWKILARDIIKQGELPLWNPYNFSGSPLLANLQTAVFYPTMILFFLFSDPVAWTLSVFLQPFLASVFMYMYARTIGRSVWGSLLAGISFGFSFYMSVFLEYNTLGHVMVWLPFLLFCIELLQKRKSWMISILFSVGVAFAGFAGHLQIFAGLIAFVLLYIWSLAWVSKRFRIAVYCTCLLLIGIGLTAIQMIPTWELISLSARSNQSYDFLIHTLLLQPKELLLFFNPDMFGNPVSRTYSLAGSYPSRAVSIGLIGLFFAFLSLKRHMQKKQLFFVVMSSIILFFLLHTPFTEVFYRLPIPFVSTSSPTNFMFLLSFCLSLLAGWGFDTYITRKNTPWKHGIFFVSSTLIVVVLSFLAKGSTSAALYTIGVIFSLSFVVIIKQFLPKGKTIALICLILLASADLWYFFTKFNPFVPSALVFPHTQTATWMAETIGSSRFWGYGTAGIEANFPTQMRLSNPDGYDPLYPKYYGELILGAKDGTMNQLFTNENRSDAKIPQGFGADTFIDARREKLLDLLSVSYLLDREENGLQNVLFQTKNYAPISSSEQWRLYQRSNALPHLSLIHTYQEVSPNELITMLYSSNFSIQKQLLLEQKPDFSPDPLASGSIQLLSYTPNTISAVVTTDRPQFLLLSDTYFPGWKASINGQETPIYRANHAFRAIGIPQGTSNIIFQYVPNSFRIGLFGSILSGIALICVATFIRYES